LSNQNYQKLGTVTSGKLTVAGNDFGTIADWKAVYDDVLGGVLEAV